MTIRKILTPLTGGARDASALAAALAAARACEAKVQALFVRPDPSEALPYLGEGVSGAVIQDIIRAARDAADKSLADAKATLRSVADSAGVPLVAAPAPGREVTLSLREAQGPFDEIVSEHARLSDLVVFGPVADDASANLRSALEAALMSAGRPVLMAPPELITEVGANVVLAWDGGTAAAHAVTAALPFLARAGRVEVLSVQSPAPPASALDDVVAYLALHGVKAAARPVDPGDRPVSEALTAAARQAGADLMVMGGYGHSRLREFILGGVTRTMIGNAALPVLMAH